MTDESQKTDPDRPSLDEIVRTLREMMPDLAERRSVKSLGIFGSYIRGEADTESDLDILVEFDRSPTLWEPSGSKESWGISWESRWIW